MNNEYKQKRNRLISDLTNAEITYYSNELDLHKNDIQIKWKLKKNIIGKNTTKTKIPVLLLQLVKELLNEFNHFFVSIGPQLANNISNTVSPLSYYIVLLIIL